MTTDNFVNGHYVYRWPRPKVCVDIAVFAFTPVPSLLLIERGTEPHKGEWALPGGHMEINETTLYAARRELEEETGIKASLSSLTQVGVFDAVHRDISDRALAVAYTMMLDNLNVVVAKAGDDASALRWFGMSDLPLLAFDHEEIVIAAANVWFPSRSALLRDK